MTALDDLVTLLDLEAIEVNIFRGRSPDENRQRVFGGQVAGQALVAAARTVDDAEPPGPLAARLLPAPRRPDGADPLRGRPHPRRPQLHHPARRRHPARPGDLQPAGQLPRPRAGPRPPDADADRRCPTPSRCPTSRRAWRRTRSAWASGTTGPARSTCATSTATRSTARATPAIGQRVWLRADGRLPDDPTLHACIVTYASDMTLLDTTVLPFGWSWDSPGMQMASLDHAMWFHRPFRADEWLLYDQTAFSTSAGTRAGRRGDLHQRRHAGRHRRARGPGAGSVSREAAGLPSPRSSPLAASVAARLRQRRLDGRPRRRPRRRDRQLGGRPASPRPTTHRRRSTPRRDRTARRPRRPRRPTATDGTAAAPLGDPSSTLTELGGSTQPGRRRRRDPATSRLYVVEQDGHRHARRRRPTGRRSALDIDRAHRRRRRAGVCSAWPSTRRRPLAYVDYTNNDGDTAIDEYSPSAPTARSTRRLGARCSSFDQPYAEPQRRRRWRSAPTACCTSAWATAARAATRSDGRSNIGELLGKILRIDPHASGDAAVHGPGRQPVRRRRRRPPGDLVDRPAQPVAVQLRPVDRRPVDRRRRPGPVGGGRRRLGRPRAAAAALNFGWSAFEGTHRFNDDQPTDGVDAADLRVPARRRRLLDQRRRAATAASAIPALVGWYVFGDYCSGQIRALQIADRR